MLFRSKASIYARAGVAAYFIANVADRTIEVYGRVEAGRYTETTVHRGDERVAVPGFPDVTFSADEIFVV